MAIGAALQLTTQGAPIAAPVSGICNTPHCLQTASNILKDMQASADPCVDFSQFACGGFSEREKLRPGEKKNGYLVSIDKQNIDVIRSIVTPNDPKGPVIAKGDATSKRNLRKLQSYYGACMDNNRLAKVGRKPLQDEIRKLTRLFPVTNTPTAPSNGTRVVLSPANRQALSTLWGYNMKHGFENPIAWDLWDDETNPGYKMLTAQQSGLGLKDEALYNDEKLVALYEKVIGKMFYIIQGNGKPQSTIPQTWQQVGKDVVAFEKILAGVEIKPEAAETATPKKKRADDAGAETGAGAETEEEIGDGEGDEEEEEEEEEDEDDFTIVWDKISDLDEATPSLDWNVIFKNALPADVPLPENINMLWKFYFRRLETALETMPLKTVQNYFIWTLLRNLGGNLAEPLQRPLVELKKALPDHDATASTDRWKGCVQLVNENLGDLAGHFFVKATFPEESQAIMNEMIGSLRWSFEKSFWDYDWLDPRTRQAALQKLKAIVPKVGFSTSSPNVGLSASVDEYYRPLVINGKDHFGNQIRASTWKTETMFRGMTKPSNRVKLASIPQTVNAFYNPNMNSIEILAGILRAPFFDAAVPEYLNYAGIGVVAAHELGHAFDNRGRGYDETGAIREWWEESSIQEFDTRSQCFIEQYNEYTIDGPGGKKHNINGWSTLGENIADNGGLKIAYDAWAQRKRNHKYNNKALPGLERYTPEQLFFIQYARAHCGNMTPEESVKMLNDDNHSPKKWRINGVVLNSDHFAKAFQCKAGAPMNPTKKCVLL
ncbi:hypothetical protein BGZ97_009991 [Linnemannia gamsii]|uniref:Zincin n=1 Tax=Linnemannia gamsii TaxID=64522 RepID=A0A9P6R928_9FUNG|nr:hypothetical protein BGZ97_009991 [Linnemannia gamsii]